MFVQEWAVPSHPRTVLAPAGIIAETLGTALGRRQPAAIPAVTVFFSVVSEPIFVGGSGSCATKQSNRN